MNFLVHRASYLTSHMTTVNVFTETTYLHSYKNNFMTDSYRDSEKSVGDISNQKLRTSKQFV
jgi:hypothetical protein